MKKNARDEYIFRKKCLLVLLFLYYLNDVSYDSIVLRSFGFHFDPTCDFKAIVKSKKEHIHKYVVHIYLNAKDIDLENMDVMGNVNFIRIKDASKDNFYVPIESLNIYFDGVQFVSAGYIEGKYFTRKYFKKETAITDELLYHLSNDFKGGKYNSSANEFVVWLLKLYTNKLNTDLVIGAGINAEYGALTWNGVMDSLNNDFYKGDYKFADEIKHYVGKELFTYSMVLKTSGFDPYKSINRELYLYDQKKNFDDETSTLYHCVNYILNHKGTSVITYNYDTNLEYLFKKRNILYTTIYDDTSFVNKDSAVNIYHVHGLLPYNRYQESRFTDSLIFNESEYYYLYNNPYSWNISKQLHDFKFNACIFIGISLTDPDMKRLLELANNYLKFNFIFIKREEGYSENVYKDITSYFFTFDLIVIWIDNYEDIGKYLEQF